MRYFPKYYQFKVAGYYLYFTSKCIIECFHVHASDEELAEGGSAKLFVKQNGDTVIRHAGVVSDRDMRKIQAFIKERYREMYLFWRSYGGQEYYRGKE